MYVNCDRIFRLTVPAVKAALVKDLSQKHDFSEKDIAKALGIAQPAISKYLSGKYGKEGGALERVIRSTSGYQTVVSATVSRRSLHEISRMIDGVASDSRIVKKAIAILS